MTPPTLTVQMPAPTVPDGYRLVEPPQFRPPKRGEWFIVGGTTDPAQASEDYSSYKRRWIIEPLPAPAPVREVTVYLAQPRSGWDDALFGHYDTVDDGGDLPISLLITGHGPGATVRLKAEVEAEKLRERNRLHEERIEQLSQQLADANKEEDRTHEALRDAIAKIGEAEKRAEFTESNYRKQQQITFDLAARLAALEAVVAEAGSMLKFAGNRGLRHSSQVNSSAPTCDELTQLGEKCLSLAAATEQPAPVKAKGRQEPGQRDGDIQFDFRDAVDNSRLTVSAAKDMSAAALESGAALEEKPAPADAERRVVEAARKWSDELAGDGEDAAAEELERAVHALDAGNDKAGG